MPLLDHFHPPVRNVLQWNSFHSAWLATLAADLNALLPPRFFAEPSARFGIEVDVAALERMGDPAGDASDGWAPTYAAPPATATVPFAVATDALEVMVYEDAPGEMRLVGAVELVSPANKDRPDSREAFVTKCREYLHRGLGLVVADVVTERRANLHNQLMTAIGQPEQAITADLYAVGYRPTGGNGSGKLSPLAAPAGRGRAAAGRGAVLVVGRGVRARAVGRHLRDDPAAVESGRAVEPAPLTRTAGIPGTSAPAVLESARSPLTPPACGAVR